MFYVILWVLGLFILLTGWGLKAVSRWDIPLAVDRFGFVPGYGHLFGIPTKSDTSNATTGVPSNSKAGYAPGALFLNFKGTGAGLMLYVNTGSVTSTTWTNVA